MKLTVLMSTYNGECYLRDQLDSIISQELPEDIELKIWVSSVTTGRRMGRLKY